MIKLSKRLAAIARYVPAQSRLADIGTDHALLPTALAQAGKIRSAVAGEINEGPFRAAVRQVREAGLDKTIRVRRGDGLSVLAPGEADVVVIAGMGGGLIAQILESGKPRLAGVHRLILQPNIGGERVRRWLLEAAWALTDETVVEEDGKFYEICVAECRADARRYNEQLYRMRRLPRAAAEAGGDNDVPLGADGSHDDATHDGSPHDGSLKRDQPQSPAVEIDRELLLLLGPHMIDRPNADWFGKWRDELGKLENVYRQISLSSSPAAAIRLAETGRRIEQIREVLSCLQMPRPSSN